MSKFSRRITSGRWTGDRRVSVTEREPIPVAPVTVKTIPRLGGTFTTGATRAEAADAMRAYREGRTEVPPEVTTDGMSRVGRLPGGVFALGKSPAEAKSALKAAKAAGAVPAARPHRSFRDYVARTQPTARDLPDSDEE